MPARIRSMPRRNDRMYKWLRAVGADSAEGGKFTLALDPDGHGDFNDTRTARRYD